MDPSALSRAINYTGNSSSRQPETRSSQASPNIPCAKLVKNEIPPDFKKLQELHDVVQSANVKLMRQIVDLQDQLKMKNEECVLMLPDELLFSEVQQRPFFDEWFKKMLGNNRELDDLRAIEKEVVKFREAIQKRLDTWKNEYKIYISLEQEFIKLDKPKPSSVTEILSLMNSEMERELLTIFRQVEENFKSLSNQLSEKSMENEELLSKIEEQVTLIKKLCHELDRSKEMIEKYNKLQQDHQELVSSEAKAKEELKAAHAHCVRLKKELAEKEAELDQMNKMVGGLELELEMVKADKYELQLICKKTEDQLNSLREAEAERKYLSDCLDKSQKSLAETRSQLRLESLKRTKVIDEAEDATSSFYESSLIESSKLKTEKALRSEIAMENEALRLKCASLQEQLRKENATEEICARNAFMIKFIQSLDVDLQMSFKEQFQKHFES